MRTQPFWWLRGGSVLELLELVGSNFDKFHIERLAWYANRPAHAFYKLTSMDYTDRPRIEHNSSILESPQVSALKIVQCLLTVIWQLDGYLCGCYFSLYTCHLINLAASRPLKWSLLPWVWYFLHNCWDISRPNQPLGCKLSYFRVVFTQPFFPCILPSWLFSADYLWPGMKEWPSVQNYFVSVQQFLTLNSNISGLDGPISMIFWVVLPVSYTHLTLPTIYSV